jgi:N-acetylneuraminate epimerase
MKRRKYLRLFQYLVPLISFMLAAPAQSESLKWKQLPSLPDKIGFAAPFAGVSEGALIVGGGANFPGAMPWEGGTKVWYDSLFVLPKTDGPWVTGFKLPHPVGYGVSVTTKDGVLCAGGSDARQHYQDVFRLRWRDGKIETENLPSLPRAMANGCGALVGKIFYVAGGIERPDSTNALKTFWALDLGEKKPQWRQLEPWPGPARMLSVAGASKDSFYLFSGVELSGDAAGKPVRRYLKDAYYFTSGRGWKQIADLPRATVAAPSPASLHEGKLHIVSGDDGELVNFEPKSKHPGFPKDVLAYDVKADAWERIEDATVSRATAPTVEWHGMTVILNGEAKPGVRTPEVWGLKLR